MEAARSSRLYHGTIHSGPLIYWDPEGHGIPGFDTYTSYEFRFMINGLIEDGAIIEGPPFDPLKVRRGKLLEWTGAVLV